MKNPILILFTFFAFTFSLNSQDIYPVIVKHEKVDFTNVNVRDSVVVLAKITINAPVTGKAMVRFDGNCHASVGDRIILAASDEPAFGVNSGNVPAEAINGDISASTFSHTRRYNVQPGENTFYAVAFNTVEMDGNGLAHIYGSLLVQYFPSYFGGTFPDAPYALQAPVEETNLDIKSDVVALEELWVNIPKPGTLVARFDGNCVSAPGDQIMLAVNDEESIDLGSDHVVIEAVNTDINRNSFSHTRVFEVEEGSQQIYAMVGNIYETAGDGFVSVYGNLTVEYIPNDFAGSNFTPQVYYEDLNLLNVDLREPLPVKLSTITLETDQPGIAVVEFTGDVTGSPGDRIVLAANNIPAWLANDGHIEMEAYDDDVNSKPFSHTRAFEIQPGEHEFYAVGQNVAEQDGNGKANVQASFVVKFFPQEEIISKTSDFVSLENELKAFPNPTTGWVNLQFEGEENTEYQITILNQLGRIVKVFNPVDRNMINQMQLDLSAQPSGIYLINIIGNGQSGTLKVIKK